MHHLSELILSYNKLSSLDGLDDLHGENFCLNILDIKCNQLEDFHELYHLVGLSVTDCAVVLLIIVAASLGHFLK